MQFLVPVEGVPASLVRRVVVSLSPVDPIFLDAIVFHLSSRGMNSDDAGGLDQTRPELSETELELPSSSSSSSSSDDKDKGSKEKNNGTTIISASDGSDTCCREETPE